MGRHLMRHWWDSRHRACCCLVAVALSAVPVAADVIELTPAQDTTLYETADGSLANGAGEYLFAGRSNQAPSLSRRRALLQFSIAGSIPPKATIMSATLTLNMSRTVSASSSTTLHRVASAWGQGTSNAPAEEGGGAPAEPGDATWLHTFHPSGFWGSAGGDFDPTPSANATVVGIGPYAWGSTAEMVADVQSWLDAPETNFGWILIGTEFLGGTAKRFDSREHPVVVNRPRLTVEFMPQVPATSTWFLIGLGLVLITAGTLVLEAGSTINPRHGAACSCRAGCPATRRTIRRTGARRPA